MHVWRLAQHGLAPRLSSQDFLQAVTRTGGIQAQVMSADELAMCTRVEGFTPRDVQSALWQDRILVKTWAMRARPVTSSGRSVGFPTTVPDVTLRMQRCSRAYLRLGRLLRHPGPGEFGAPYSLHGQCRSNEQENDAWNEQEQPSKSFDEWQGNGGKSQIWSLQER